MAFCDLGILYFELYRNILMAIDTFTDATDARHSEWKIQNHVRNLSDITIAVVFSLSLLFISPNLNAVTIDLPAPTEWDAPADAPAPPGDVFDPTFGSTATSPDSPVISEWPRGLIKSDESFALTGVRFTLHVGHDAGTDTRVWLYATDVVGGELHECDIQTFTGDYALLATIPEAVPAGMYLVWVENAAGASSPICLNRTDAAWIGPMGNHVDPGGPATKRVFGRNLSYAHGDTTAFAWLRDNTGNWRTLTAIDINPYAVELDLPADLPVGSFTIHLHNGHGGRYGWSDPVELVVSTGWERDPFTITLSPDSSGDDTSAIFNAINTIGARPDGGTVALTAGTFTIHQMMTLPAKARFIGAGKDTTTLRLALDQQEFTGIHAPVDHVAIEGMTIHLEQVTDYGSLRAGRWDAYNYDLILRDLRFTLKPWIPTTGWNLPYVLIYTSETEITDCEFFIVADLHAGDIWVHHNNLHGGPFGGSDIGLTEGAVAGTNTRFILEHNHISTPDWPNNNGDRSYRHLVDTDPDFQWRTWARRVYSSGANNHNIYLAFNTGYDVACDENKGEQFLLHGVGSTFYVQVESSINNQTLAIRTDGLINGDSDWLVDGRVPARSLSDFRDRYSNQTISPVGWYLVIISGTGIGQRRVVTDYTNTTITVDNPWRVPPGPDSIVSIQS